MLFHISGCTIPTASRRAQASVLHPHPTTSDLCPRAFFTYRYLPSPAASFRAVAAWTCTFDYLETTDCLRSRADVSADAAVPPAGEQAPTACHRHPRTCLSRARASLWMSAVTCPAAGYVHCYSALPRMVSMPFSLFSLGMFAAVSLPFGNGGNLCG